MRVEDLDRRRVGLQRTRYLTISSANVHKPVPNGQKNDPGEVSEGRLAWSRPYFRSGDIGALERVWSNKSWPEIQSNAVETNVKDLRSPVPQRRRITAHLRADVVEHYERGLSTRRVAATLGLGRTTVLQILKDASVATRPRGPR